MLEFAGRMKLPQTKNAVAELAKRCGVSPRRTTQFKEGAIFDLARSPTTAALLPAVTAEFVNRMVASREYDEKQARKMVKSIAADRARERATHEILAERREEYLARGCLLVYCEWLSGDMLVLLPTTDPLAAVTCLGPWPSGAPRMLNFLKSLADDYKFAVYGCSHATLMLQFTGKIRDTLALAKTLFRFRADERGVIVDGDTVLKESIKELAAALRKRRPIVRLWWD
jgi:hypothetical protein